MMARLHLPTDHQIDPTMPRDAPVAHPDHAAAQIVLPLALVVLGLVVLILGESVIAIVLFLAAAVAAVSDRIVRPGLVSEGDRHRERAARLELRRTGHRPR